MAHTRPRRIALPPQTEPGSVPGRYRALSYRKAAARRRWWRAAMASVLFRCPYSGRNVQSWVEDDGAEDEEVFVSVECPACTRRHLVNPKTGRVLGAGDDKRGE
jgi:hypothetical protein